MTGRDMTFELTYPLYVRRGGRVSESESQRAPEPHTIDGEIDDLPQGV